MYYSIYSLFVNTYKNFRYVQQIEENNKIRFVKNHNTPNGFLCTIAELLSERHIGIGGARFVEIRG